MNFGAEFDSSWVSKRMGIISGTILGWSMTISSYRHINIAFTQHRCKGMIDAQVEEEVMSSVHSLQSGHSVTTERRIYGLDKDSVGGVSEDLIILYLEASKVYQRAFHIPSAGQALPYSMVKMSDFSSNGKSDPLSSTRSAASGDISAVLSFLSEMKSTSDRNHETLMARVDSLTKELASLKGDVPFFCHSSIRANRY